MCCLLLSAASDGDQKGSVCLRFCVQNSAVPIFSYLGIIQLMLNHCCCVVELVTDETTF